MSSDKPFQIESDVIPKALHQQENTLADIRFSKTIDRLYDTFQKLQQAPVVLSYLEFKKFLPLFTRKFSEEVDINNPVVVAELEELSKELLSLINPQKEFHVELQDGSYITFPPFYTPVPALEGDDIQIVDKYHNFMTNCFDQPHKINEATAQFINAIGNQISKEVVDAQTKKFKILADKIYMEKIKEKQKQMSDNKEESITHGDDDDMVEFEFIPEG